MSHLLGCSAHLYVLVCDVLEQREEIDFLLEAATHRHPRRLANDRDHRLVIELSIVEPVQQMNGTWTGSGETHADLA